MTITWLPGEDRREVRIPTHGMVLEGELAIPAGSRGVVLFVTGTGGRRSPRNQFVAQALRNQGFATLLIDLLTAREEDLDRFTGHLRFDVPLLAARLVGVAGWLAADPATNGQAIGLFGTGNGGGVALAAAAERPDRFRAVVLRGGRPDLAGAALDRVEAPSLFLVGALDPVVAELNERAIARVRAAKRLVVVAGASHQFEEPGALEEVARLAGRWYDQHLAGPVTRPTA